MVPTQRYAHCTGTCCRDDLGQRSFIDFCTVQAELRSRKESVVFGWSQRRFRRKLGVGVRFFYPNTDILRKGGSHGISKKGSTQVIHFPLPTLFAKWRLLVWPGDIYTSFTRENSLTFWQILVDLEVKLHFFSIVCSLTCPWLGRQRQVSSINVMTAKNWTNQRTVYLGS